MRPVTASTVYAYPAKFGDYYVAEFNAFQFYDRTADSDDKVLSVTYDGETVVNPNCGEQSGDGENGEDAKDDGTEHKKGEKAKKEKKKEKGHYDEKDKKHENTGDKGDNDGDDGTVTVDPDALEIEAVCVDSELGTARFRVENENDASVSVGYNVHGADRSGSVGVQPNSATYFEVPTADGEAHVSILDDDGEPIDAAESATETECIPRSRLGFDARCVDPETGKARFYVRSGAHADLTFVYRIAETGESGTVTIPDDMTAAEVFWAGVPDDGATAALFYEGHPIETVAVDPDEHC